jgi:hypothetical protein
MVNGHPYLKALSASARTKGIVSKRAAVALFNEGIGSQGRYRYHAKRTQFDEAVSRYR